MDSDEFRRLSHGVTDLLADYLHEIEGRGVFPDVDSITVDPHKWFFAPLDAGALLVRDQERLRSSSASSPPT